MATTPDTIRAQIHQDAISRVTCFYSAAPREILNELLQNAHHSGATRVSITSGTEESTVTDDGRSIFNPADLLAFDPSGWEEQTVQREEAAGMGLFCLASCRHVTIRSSDGTRPWQVRRSPEHFTGEQEAPVEILNSAQTPKGGSITLSTKLSRAIATPAAQ